VHKLTGNQSLCTTHLLSAVILLSNVALTYFCFYRAMHMHNEDFAVARCPSSVRLSVTWKQLNLSSNCFQPSIAIALIHAC